MTGDAAFKAKIQFIKQAQKTTLTDATEFERALFKELISNFVNQLQQNKGVIVANKDNLQMMAALDKVLTKFENKVQLSQMKTFVDNAQHMLTLNDKYFSLYETNGKKFSSLRSSVKDNLLRRIGINASNQSFVKDGFIDNYIKSQKIRVDLKKTVFNFVTGGRPINDLIDTLNVKVQGSTNASGIIEKQIRDYVYDKYTQFDRATNTEFSKRLDLRAFIYAGGLIETSREFCIQKNNKVFTTDEANKLWPIDKNLPRTKAEKESGVLEDYNPLDDCGRWRCRHLPRYISNQEAIRQRPDLKNVL